MSNIIFKKPEDVLQDFHYAKMDDKVFVWNDYEDKIPGHFAGISQNGKPMVFCNGKTSWTASPTEVYIYDNCQRIY